ncbi:hypothetical protein MES5069_370149 [Mesorhizobium escarrei]|uniref:Uncharacterized protein n=1 Tax=Mesorhizobium escarrei TaxID=666018 RepID=A0ABM9E2Z2_9HYPH|nr:hypothetical protein MES5069_370149 [Mesorhizobium escarrei]
MVPIAWIRLRHGVGLVAAVLRSPERHPLPSNLGQEWPKPPCVDVEFAVSIVVDAVATLASGVLQVSDLSGEYRAACQPRAKAVLSSVI